MGREVRRVPKDWQHPKDERGSFIPKLDRSYADAAREFTEKVNADGLQAAMDWFGSAPEAERYMPDWPESERTHLMMYEDTSEGTPISPAFETPEELARWLADNNASAFGGMTATYEQWLAVARRGWAPSAIISNGYLMSGVEAAEKVSK